MSLSSDMPADTPDSSSPKIAVKGISFGSKATPKPISFAPKTKPLPTTLGKRPRTVLHDGSDDGDEDSTRHEAVTGFDIREGGALKKDAENVIIPLVIPKLRTKNWRDEIRRHRRKGKNLLPPDMQAQNRGEGLAGGTENVLSKDSEPKWGLTITKKVIAKEGTMAIDAQVSNEDVAEANAEKPRERTDDERAIEALMGVVSDNKVSNLVIPIAKAPPEEDYQGHISENDAYRRAIEAAPDVSTLEDYERIPVEEFGAALLRGMGWKEGDGKNGKVERPKEVKRRQNLLGLGATELKGAEELGAWVQKSDPKRLIREGGRGGERKPRVNEYREREERKRESREERYGGSYRRDRGDYRDRDRRR
jgi:G-patch domain